ncbi:vitamin B6 photo-protection and homoeostasis-domain-containing protein [Lophiotrema nucula]|uniref:Vitamin B6 photo-protection and homoeostasis-domain-containing protein n=1 Tax=Lophiotrema nucula TaxID=690887 RepID=A0A6A5ZE22_9PLEO|nr:vitamin B6 photo-protection and homoeostasis-domain-containing protein [Lophiotrema nucula]
MTTAKEKMLEIVERDEAGNIVASYVESRSEKRESSSRVDVILPKETKSYSQQLLDVFLPAGYPSSVTEDYIHYQIYDSLQAFSSSIAGLISSRAVLEGVGVGDASASPTAALLLSVLQESMGRIVTILFAHRLGTALEPECKMYRFAADIFNDTSMILDCLSPAFPKGIRVLVLSFSSVLRSLCGVCAGSSKASLSAHFAKKGNLGELNAKDSSQETVISLLGMLAGSVVVSWISSPLATWTTLIFLLGVHLTTNYFAVTAVSMRSLNRQRANIVLSHMLAYGTILRPADVSRLERVFERDGILRSFEGNSRAKAIGHCKIGMTLESVLRRMGRSHYRTGSLNLRIKLSELLRIYENEAYVLWFEEGEYGSRSEAWIVLKEDATPTDQLKAWCQALLLAQQAHTRRAKAAKGKRELERSEDAKDADGSASESEGRLLAELRLTTQEVRKLFDAYVERLTDVGWDLEIAALETRAGTRMKIGSHQH